MICSHVYLLLFVHHSMFFFFCILHHSTHYVKFLEIVSEIVRCNMCRYAWQLSCYFSFFMPCCFCSSDKTQCSAASSQQVVSRSRSPSPAAPPPPTATRNMCTSCFSGSNYDVWSWGERSRRPGVLKLAWTSPAAHLPLSPPLLFWHGSRSTFSAIVLAVNQVLNCSVWLPRFSEMKYIFLPIRQEFVSNFQNNYGEIVSDKKRKKALATLPNLHVPTYIDLESFTWTFVLLSLSYHGINIEASDFIVMCCCCCCSGKQPETQMFALGENVPQRS